MIFRWKDGANSNFLAWAPDGHSLAVSLSVNRGVAVVELAAPAKPRGLEDFGTSCLAWSPDGKTLARCHDNWVQLYDATTGKRQRSLSEGSTQRPQFAWSPNGQTFAVADAFQVAVISARTGQTVATLKDATLPLAWSSDGKRLATGGPNHTIFLWDNDLKNRIVLKDHQHTVLWLAWSPDGKRLASSAGEEKRVLLWDTDKGTRFRELGPFAWPARSLAWSSDGRLLVFRVEDPGQDAGWHLWNVKEDKLANDPAQWKGHALTLAPDGRTALILSNGLGIYEWRDLANGKERGRLPANPYQFPAPVWSPDGRLLLTQTATGLEVWRGDLRRRLRTLPATQRVEEAAFSADGKLVAGLASERLHLWESDTGRLRGILLLGEHYDGLTVLPDGRYTGNQKVESGIVMVVQKDDGTQELLEPADFEQKYGFKNEPDKVDLLQPLPPPLYPLPGMPMGPHALVRQPAELPDANSWTLETVSARGLVRAVAYRPDGKLLATGGEDGTIRLWDPSDGKLIRMLVGPFVGSLSWSHDGKVLAASSHLIEDGVRLWDADSGRLLRRLSGSWSAALSPDGRTLALWQNLTLQLYDIATRRIVRKHQFPGATQLPTLCWSPDGKTLALASRSVRLWDVSSGKERLKLEGHENMDRAVAWSLDSKRLVSLEDRAFCVWEAATGKLRGRFGVPCGHTTAAAWSPDGKTVALGTHPGPQGLFDPETGKPLRTFEAGQTVIALAWSPDGKQVTLAGDGGVRTYNAATGKVTHVLEKSSPVGVALTWSPDGRRLAVGLHFPADELHIVAAATGERDLAPAGARLAPAWSPDGKILAAVVGKYADQRVRLWDAATHRPLRTLEYKVEHFDGPLLAWSPDGAMLAGGELQRVWVWSAQTGKRLWQNAKHQEVCGLAWSPDGRRLATTDRGDKGAVRIWEADTGKLLHEVPLRSWGLAWSPDGKTLAAGSTDRGGECLLIDSASGSVRVKMPNAGWNTNFRWAPDGKTFTTLEEGVRLRVRDAATGKIRREVPLPRLLEDRPREAWSPDGRILARLGGWEIHLCDSDGLPLGVLLPFAPFEQLAVTAAGHFRGNARVERAIRMVVQKRDGTTETLTPREFAQRYPFKNDPDKVRLTDNLPPR